MSDCVDSVATLMAQFTLGPNNAQASRAPFLWSQRPWTTVKRKGAGYGLFTPHAGESSQPSATHNAAI